MEIQWKYIGNERFVKFDSRNSKFVTIPTSHCEMPCMPKRIDDRRESRTPQLNVQAVREAISFD
ncbi:MAG: hypothetical protein A2Z72_01815 [Omnitrophica bacterium RBG_13_46_9]|nr:MAG: hypothetical protein A2Z72_01815 [Omnitrophica bacterium RBG_13_46_9]